MSHQRNNIQKILISIHPIYNYISAIYICIYVTKLASNEMFSPSNKILLATLILLPALLYTIPTVTNNKEINIHDTIIENEITTTRSVIQNQIIETVNITNVTNTSCYEYSIKTPDDGQ